MEYITFKNCESLLYTWNFCNTVQLYLNLKKQNKKQI